MKILFYSVKDFERQYLLDSNNNVFEISLTAKPLSLSSAAEAKGFDAVCIFTGDDASAPVIEQLHDAGVRFIAIRAAGHDNVNIDYATGFDIRVANVPEYSPYAIAEHALALMLALDRKLILADKQVHNNNFTVTNLVGFDLHGKTVGIIGTGKIGTTLIKILRGFGCRLLAYDVQESNDLADMYGVEYVPLNILCRESDIISLHTCLTPQTKHMIDGKLMDHMKRGVMIINTSRGACIKTEDLLSKLENGHIGYFGGDVYENERGVFFYDWSERELNDPLLKKLLSFPNVLITPHQAFATQEALKNIAQTTFDNIQSWANNQRAANELTPAYLTIGYGEDEEA